MFWLGIQWLKSTRYLFCISCCSECKQKKIASYSSGVTVVFTSEGLIANISINSASSGNRENTPAWLTGVPPSVTLFRRMSKLNAINEAIQAGSNVVAHTWSYTIRDPVKGETKKLLHPVRDQNRNSDEGYTVQHGNEDSSQYDQGGVARRLTNCDHCPLKLA